MRRHPIGTARVLLACLPALAWAGIASAAQSERPPDARYGVRPPSSQGGDGEAVSGSATDACRTALGERIRSEHPHTDEIEIAERSLLEWSYSRTERAVAGDGRMRRGTTWDELDFVCVVEGRAGRVVALEWSGPLHQGRPVRPGEQEPRRLLAPLESGAPAGRACAEAVGAEIRREHPRSGQLELERTTLRQWRRSATEVGVLGEGRFAGARGRPHPIEFTCVWDTRRGAIGAVYYELQ